MTFEFTFYLSFIYINQFCAWEICSLSHVSLSVLFFLCLIVAVDVPGLIRLLLYVTVMLAYDYLDLMSFFSYFIHILDIPTSLFIN